MWQVAFLLNNKEIPVSGAKNLSKKQAKDIAKQLSEKPENGKYDEVIAFCGNTEFAYACN